MSAPADATFYRSPGEAAAAPQEQLAYVVAFDRSGEQPDALAVLDVDAGSADYGRVVGWVQLPTRGDELHHFGWNACSSALMHAGHDMHGLSRRYLSLHTTRSDLAAAGQDHHGGRVGGQGRLLASAHAALRTGRNLLVLSRRR